MAVEPLSTYTPRELIFGGYVAATLRVFSATLLLALAVWSLGLR
jgi:hypothetical protein